ncbi:unnamed protein product, partial [marine sediment metagenome]
MTTATVPTTPAPGATPKGAIVPHEDEDHAQLVRRLRSRLNAIRQLVDEFFTKDIDFGIIPGCKKPSLLKPGAEKVCALFALAPSYVVIEKDLPNGHREYRVTCTLTDPSERSWGEGVG